jgi:hypothetical protein
MTLRKTTKAAIRIAGIPDEIRTKLLSDVSIVLL